MSSLHFHPLRVRELRRDTDDAVVLTLDAPEPLREIFRYRAGQYLTLRQTIDGQDLRRSYSICAGADEQELRVGIRKVPGGTFSTWVHEQLQPGVVLQVIPPQGHFCAPDEAATRHYLAIAGGSGITPILSIMKTVLAREPHSRFTLIYANRNQKSAMFKEELEDLKNRYLTRLVLHHVYSREQIDAPLSSGRLDAERIGRFLALLIPPASLDAVYLCGPLGLIDAAQTALHAAGVADERVHVERFGAPDAAAGQPVVHEARPEDADHARITLIRDGLQREIEFRRDAPSILDAATEAGLEMPYSCKSGVCSTCRARVVSGEVRMDRNFSLDAAEVAAGFVLTCQAHPLTERVVLSFDER